MENTFDKIDRYIRNEMDVTEKTAFEKELQENANLKEQYLQQLSIVKGINRAKLSEKVKASVKQIKLVKKAINIGIVIAAISIIAGGVYLLKEKVSKPKENNIRYQLNEEGNANWAEADKILESQVFHVNPTKDTVIETKGGIIFSIPANIFLNQHGETEKENVEIEIKEALNAYDIMRAGLSTTSNGNLLETGGMFYFNARNSKSNLDIDKRYEVGVAVPYAGKKEMMLFDGERKADGSINWINPKPTKKQLTTVDITGLNFYPPHYFDTLAKWGYDVRNKAFTDSLYYSFVCGYGSDSIKRSAVNATSAIIEDKIKDTISITASLATKFPKTTTKNMFYPKTTAKKTLDGKALFKQNCAVCHAMTDEKLSGPGLAGIVDRAPEGNWLFEFIKDNTRLIKSGDAYANKIFKENGNAAMSVFDGVLSDDQINAIVGYISNGRNGFIIPTSNKICNHYESETSEIQCCDEINPSRIKAIWDKQFNNTILATKEFEERLQVIFTTCDDRLLNLYVMNLDKELSQIDSVAAIYATGDAKQKFEEFYKRGDAGVSITNKQQQLLAKYCAEKKKIYEDAANKAFQKHMKEEADKDAAISKERNKQYYKEMARNNSNYNEEYNLNLKEAYRQLGKELPAPPPSSNMLVTGITTTGWKNVDRYVLESVASRTTLNYTDSESGKKAVIKYESLTIKVNDFSNYDRVAAYLLPDKLNSFQLMKQSNGEFTENINELINYNLAIVGFKGNDTYYYEERMIKPQSKTVDLNEIDSKDLVAKINGSFTLMQQNDFLENLDYQMIEAKEVVRQKKIKADAEMRNRLYYIIYPCHGDYVSWELSAKMESAKQDSIARADSIANAEAARMLAKLAKKDSIAAVRRK